MLLLVDGYNVTMRDPATSGHSKEAQRDALVARLAAHAGRLAPRGKIVAVFDAKAELGHSTEPRGPVTAVYARVADDEIVRRCASATGEVTVATSDMRLRARISQDVGRHVRFLEAEELSEAGVARSRKKASGARMAREVGLPKGANDVTEELKKLWLSEDEQ